MWLHSVNTSFKQKSSIFEIVVLDLNLGKELVEDFVVKIFYGLVGSVYDGGALFKEACSTDGVTK